MAKKPSGPYTKGKVGTPAYRPVGEPKASRKMVAPPAYLTSKTVVRSPKVSTGTPGTKNYVPRVPGGAHQRKPGAGGMERFMSAMGSVLRTKTRKPTK